jgi:hypothetical protein
VPHAVLGLALARVHDGNPLAVLAQQYARIALLTAAGRVEDRAVELDAVLVHRDDPRSCGLRVGVGPEDKLRVHSSTPLLSVGWGSIPEANSISAFAYAGAVGSCMK